MLGCLLVVQSPAGARLDAETGREAGDQIHRLLAGEVEALTFDYCGWRFQLLDGARVSHDVVTASGEERAGSTARDRLRVSVTRAGTTIASRARSERSCRRIFRRARRHYEAAVEKAIARMWESGSVVYARLPEIARVQDLVVELWVQDRAARLVAQQAEAGSRTDRPAGGAPAWERCLARAGVFRAEDHSTQVLEEVIAHYGWIDRHRFGEKVSSLAADLALSADSHPDFQQAVLDRMASLLDNDGVRRDSYARLWDRVAVSQGRLQRYGTQPASSCREDGTPRLQPVEDPAGLDERRRAMGLGPAQADKQTKADGGCRRQGR